MDGIILVDKNEDMTSYYPVKLVKKIFNSKKVGHCGTLDPFASGLLILGFNQGTKLLYYLEHDTKEYIATIKLGSKTDSYDKDGKVIETKDISIVSKEKLIEVLNSFLGTIKQVPPIYSSIHVNGHHLYEYARNNQEVEIPTREVTINSIELLEYNNYDLITFKVNCSRGTYIRSLALDIALATNNLGHLISLRRTSIGKFKVDDANRINDLENSNVKVLPLDKCVNFKCVEVKDSKTLITIYNGQTIKLDNNEEKLGIIDNGNLIAIYIKDGNLYKCEKGLFNEDIRFKRIEKLQGK